MLLAVVLRSHASAQEKVARVEGFPSSGKKIRLERFSTAHPGYHPAVFLTYGSSGLTARGDALRDYARRLADHGYVVFLIHYFDATDSATAGTLPVSLPIFGFGPRPWRMASPTRAKIRRSIDTASGSLDSRWVLFWLCGNLPRTRV